MNRHFYNFVAIFNWSSKTNRREFVFPLRNKQILVVLDVLAAEGVITGYELPKKFFYNNSGAELFSKKLGNYYTPVRVFLKDGLRPVIKSVGTPGKRFSFQWKKLSRIWKRVGPSAIVIVSSSKLKKICNAVEVLRIGEGATPLFIVHFESHFNI